MDWDPGSPRSGSGDWGIERVKTGTALNRIGRDREKRATGCQKPGRTLHSTSTHWVQIPKTEGETEERSIQTTRKKKGDRLVPKYFAT